MSFRAKRRISFYILKEKREIPRCSAPRNDNPLEFLELPYNKSVGHLMENGIRTKSY